LFFKKKENNEEMERAWYCVGILSRGRIDADEHDRIADKILNSVDNVGIVSGFVKDECDPALLQILYRRFYQPDFSSPCLIINEIIQENIEREMKLLEKKHKWKKRFGMLSFTDYQEAETKAIFNFNETLYFTEDVDAAIEFLKKQAAAPVI